MTEATQDDAQPVAMQAQPRLRDPATAAFIAFPLAFWGVSDLYSLWSLGYVLEITRVLRRTDDDLGWYSLATMVLPAVFALGVYLFARAALVRTQIGDRWWQSSLLRAAMAMAALTFVFRMIATAVLLLAWLR